MKTTSSLAPLLAALLLPACGGSPAATGTTPTTAKIPPAPAATATAAPSAEARPPLRLPADAHPTAEAIELTIQPEQDRFAGKVDIDVALDQPRQKLWLHGRGLHVSAATVTPDGLGAIPATWGDEDDHGLGALTLASAAPAGHVKVHIEYDGAFTSGTRGLFKTKQAGVAYAFTQFEAIDARRAFPCFDEPGFKIPFTVTLDVPAGDAAITNTAEVGRDAGDAGLVHVRFAQTKPLPSYLIAFAVGPLDVVNAPDMAPNAVRSTPVPLRGIAPKGRGKEMAYSLGHIGDIIARLETYFGIAYPYDKLDILAVPDMGGAMENAGAVTFSEDLLLFDEKTAPTSQRKAYAMVAAHELSHQWFGDLVTMAWWDDTWLNESFAEWMGYRVANQMDPSLHEDLDFAEGAQQAIGTDSLVHARQIHQPITSADDIENAFDDTTYQKGAAVIAMFERWLSPEVFQKGVRLHLTQKSFGNATVDDFLGALSTAAGKDVATPYRTFLDQPGVPYIATSVVCDGAGARLHLSQSRYLPSGSPGAPAETWQVPVCAKYSAGGTVQESCTLLTAAEGDVALGATCPAWVFPNAAGTGYYRFSMVGADLAKVRAAALPGLTTPEKMAYGNSLRAAYNTQAITYADAVAATEPLANDPDARVAREAMGFVSTAHDWFFGDAVEPNVEGYAQKLYAGAYARLGWERRPTDGEAAIEMRGAVIRFLSGTAHDPRVRAEAKRRGLAYLGYKADGAIHKDAVDQDLAGTAVAVVGQDADGPLFDAMLSQFAKTDDDVVRGTLLWAISSVHDPALAARARDLVLDDRLKYTEMLTPLWAQLGAPETRDAAWGWLKDHWDAVSTRASTGLFAGVTLLAIPEVFCDEAHQADVTSFLTDRAAKVDGGPRALAKSLEEIQLCVARRTAEQESARGFFAKRK